MGAGVLGVKHAARHEEQTFFRNALLILYLMPSSAILFIWLIAFDYGEPINRTKFKS